MCLENGVSDFSFELILLLRAGSDWLLLLYFYSGDYKEEVTSMFLRKEDTPRKWEGKQGTSSSSRLLALC